MSFGKFEDYTYVRPVLEDYQLRINDRIQAMKKAVSGEVALAVLKDQLADNGHFDTMYQVAYIRNSVDTSDAFYEAEIDYFNESNPVFALDKSRFEEAVLESPYLADMKAVYGDLFFERMVQNKRLVKEENVQNQIEENKLVQAYFQVAGGCNTDFHGEKVNFYGLLKYMESSDREIRKEAMTAWSALYASVADMLDEIYAKMIEVRCRMAETLGLRDYTEMMYLAYERYSYTREDVARYRDNIIRYIVPVVSEIYRKRAQILGIDQVYFYDEGMADPAGNADPEGSPDQLVDCAQQMYRELSPETGEFFDFMCEHRLFDLVTGPTKQQGGYCTFVPDLAAPFIFSNFNGTSQDVDVLTHEAGHAFEAYAASRNGVPLEILFSTSEVAEIHSMSMELFTYPWMEKFFGSKEKADSYRKSHLQDALIVLPYQACVDEFQHEVYDKKMTDAADRYALWHRLEQKYMPWRKYDGDAFLEKGGYWLQKQHIFMCPFYYIDYSLARIGSLEFYLRDLKDHEESWNAYLTLCRAGGSRGYRELLALAGLHNPFDDETLPWIMDQLKAFVI